MCSDYSPVKNAALHALAWLWNALITSVISGAGFFFIAVVVEYLKQYGQQRREIKRQREEMERAYRLSQSPILPSAINSKGAAIFSSYRNSPAFLSSTPSPRRHSFAYQVQLPESSTSRANFNDWLTSPNLADPENNLEDFQLVRGDNFFSLDDAHKNFTTAIIAERIKIKHGINMWSEISTVRVNETNDDSGSNATIDVLKHSVNTLPRNFKNTGESSSTSISSNSERMSQISHDCKISFQKQLISDMVTNYPFIIPFLKEKFLKYENGDQAKDPTTSKHGKYVENKQTPLANAKTNTKSSEKEAEEDKKPLSKSDETAKAFTTFLKKKRLISHQSPALASKNNKSPESGESGRFRGHSSSTKTTESKTVSPKTSDQQFRKKGSPKPSINKKVSPKAVNPRVNSFRKKSPIINRQTSISPTMSVYSQQSPDNEYGQRQNSCPVDRSHDPHLNNDTTDQPIVATETENQLNIEENELDQQAHQKDKQDSKVGFVVESVKKKTHPFAGRRKLNQPTVTKKIARIDKAKPSFKCNIHNFYDESEVEDELAGFKNIKYNVFKQQEMWLQDSIHSGDKLKNEKIVAGEQNFTSPIAHQASPVHLDDIFNYNAKWMTDVPPTLISPNFSGKYKHTQSKAARTLKNIQSRSDRSGKFDFINKNESPIDLSIKRGNEDQSKDAQVISLVNTFQGDGENIQNKEVVNSENGPMKDQLLDELGLEKDQDENIALEDVLKKQQKLISTIEKSKSPAQNQTAKPKHFSTLKREHSWNKTVNRLRNATSAKQSKSKIEDRENLMTSPLKNQQQMSGKYKSVQNSSSHMTKAQNHSSASNSADSNRKKQSKPNMSSDNGENQADLEGSHTKSSIKKTNSVGKQPTKCLPSRSAPKTQQHQTRKHQRKSVVQESKSLQLKKSRSSSENKVKTPPSVYDSRATEENSIADISEDTTIFSDLLTVVEHTEVRETKLSNKTSAVKHSGAMETKSINQTSASSKTLKSKSTAGVNAKTSSQQPIKKTIPKRKGKALCLSKKKPDLKNKKDNDNLSQKSFESGGFLLKNNETDDLRCKQIDELPSSSDEKKGEKSTSVTLCNNLLERSNGRWNDGIVSSPESFCTSNSEGSSFDVLPINAGTGTTVNDKSIVGSRIILRKSVLDEVVEQLKNGTVLKPVPSLCGDCYSTAV